MKTPPGTEVDLGPGHVVLDGDPGPPRERGTAAPPSFRPMSIVGPHLTAAAELLF